MELILFIAVIVLFVYFQNRLSRIEDLINKLSQNKLLNEAIASNQISPKAVEQAPMSKSSFAKIPIIDSDEVSSPLYNFFRWFSKDWILKLGALFILLGFIWLVSYAFINGWIGEQGRILLGLICGGCILLFGHFRIKKAKEQGVIFEVVGAGIMIVSVYSAQFFYKMFTPEIALLLILFVVASVGLSSIVNSSKSLIALSAFIAFIAPFLLGNTPPDVILILWYVFTICVGSLWITFLKNWRFLFIICAFFAFLYSFIIFEAEGYKIFSSFVINSIVLSTPPSHLLWFRFFALSFISLFLVSSVSLLAFYKTIAKTDYTFSAIISALSIFYILSLAPKELQSLFFLFVSLILIIVSFYIFKLKINGSYLCILF